MPNRNNRGDNVSHWVARNNIFIAPASQPRKLFREAGADRDISTASNIMVNITGVPSGNYINVGLGFLQKGDRSWPFYRSASKNSFLVDHSTETGLPFLGSAPDVGAYKLGQQTPLSVGLALLGSVVLVAIIPLGLFRLSRLSRLIR